MKSPFAIFRKHQKVLMVVLTGLAMFAFVVLDSLTQNMAAFPPIFGCVIGIAIAWMITRNMKHSWAYLLVGGIAGVLLGSQLQKQTQATNAVVKTSVGGLTEQELQQVFQRRQIVNQFLSQAFFKAHEGEENPPTFALQQQLFNDGGDPDRQALMHVLMMEEAKKLKIDINDSQLKQYVDQVTNNKLSGQNFMEICRGLRLSGDEFFELLREQLIARQARQLIMPRLLSSPEEYWDAYQKLNVKQEMAVIPIAAESFVSQLPEPSEDELKKLFEEYKEDYPGEKSGGAPGFRQSGKIRLAYLEVDYDTVEKTIPEISDAEITTYYEENKEEFRNDVTPAFPSDMPLPSLPGLPITPESPAATPDKEMPQPDDAASETSGPSLGTPGEKPAEKPEAPPQKSPTEQATEKPDSEPTESPKAPENGEHSSIKKLPFGRSLASIQPEQPPVENEPAEEASAEKPQTADGEKPSSEKESSEKPPAETNPGSEKTETPTEKQAGPADKKEMPADEPSSVPPVPSLTPPANAPAMEKEEEKEPLPEFKPLDDNLKEQIRQQLLEQKTRAKMAQIATEAFGEVLKTNEAYAVAEEKDQAKVAAEIQQKLQAYAKENSLRYVETPFYTPEELEDSEDHPLGGATEPVANPFERPNARTVLEQHFAVDNIESLIRQRYRPMEAEDPGTLNRFVHWQIDFSKPHIPTWDEEGIQEQVKQAWTQIESQKLAEKRAAEVLDLLKKSEKPMSEALEGVTETGQEGSQTLVVSYTGEFSWLSRSTAPNPNPFAPPPMEITQIPIIFGGVDDNFMKTVFNELGNGDLGTVWGEDRRYIFVTRVDNRTDLAQVRTDFMGPQANLTSFFSPYQMLVQSDGQEISRVWFDQLNKKYQVEWIEEEEE